MIRVKVSGFDALADALQQIPEAVGPAEMRGALQEGAEPLAQRMRENLAPHRRTGNLAESVEVVPKKTDAGVRVAVGPSGDGFYGRFLEFGTSHQPAQPWARPAWDGEQTTVIERFVEALRRRVVARIAALARKAK